MRLMRLLRAARDNSSLFRASHGFLREPYYRMLEALFPYGVEVTLPHNCTVRLSPRFLGIRPEKYEPPIAALIDKRVEKGMTVVDVGAHVGLHALRMSKRVGESGRVIVVEPSPANAALLRKHIEWNGCPNVTIVEAVVGEQPGEIEFVYRTDATDPGGFANSIAYDVGGETASIEMTTIDAICEGIKPDLIKIDIEGAELLALRGAKKTLLSAHPYLIVAIHPEAMKALSAAPTEVIEFMQAIGYRGRHLDDRIASAPGFEEIIFEYEER